MHVILAQSGHTTRVYDCSPWRPAHCSSSSSVISFLSQHQCLIFTPPWHCCKQAHCVLFCLLFFVFIASPLLCVLWKCDYLNWQHQAVKACLSSCSVNQPAAVGLLETQGLFVIVGYPRLPLCCPFLGLGTFCKPDCANSISRESWLHSPEQMQYFFHSQRCANYQWDLWIIQVTSVSLRNRFSKE